MDSSCRSRNIKDEPGTCCPGRKQGSQPVLVVIDQKKKKKST